MCGLLELGFVVEFQVKFGKLFLVKSILLISYITYIYIWTTELCNCTI